MTESAFRAALHAQLTQSPPPGELARQFADWPDEAHPDVCAHCAHTLQHDGAGPDAWQPWLALAAWGWALDGTHWRSRAIALALGIETRLASLWPAVSTAPRQPANLALACLSGILPTPPADQLPDLVADLDADSAWEILPQLVQAQDWPHTAQVVATLAADAREAGGASTPWDAATAPGYEPAHVGAYACALRAGFPADLLSEADRAVFWPAAAGQDFRWPAAWGSPAA